MSEEGVCILAVPLLLTLSATRVLASMNVVKADFFLKTINSDFFVPQIAHPNLRSFEFTR